MSFILNTDRLLINSPKESDLVAIVSILKDKVYSENTINIPFPYDIEDAQYWINLAEEGYKNRNQYVFAIRLKTNPTIIGGIDLRIDKQNNKGEIGYWLDKVHWNKGLMTEALKAIIDFGFQQFHLSKIEARHFSFNKASGKVMQKAGMIEEGFLHAHVKKNGINIDEVMYGILNKPK